MALEATNCSADSTGTYLSPSGIASIACACAKLWTTSTAARAKHGQTPGNEILNAILVPRSFRPVEALMQFNPWSAEDVVFASVSVRTAAADTFRPLQGRNCLGPSAESGFAPVQRAAMGAIWATASAWPIRSCPDPRSSITVWWSSHSAWTTISKSAMPRRSTFYARRSAMCCLQVS